MSHNERTGHRPSGFSFLLREFSRTPPLLDYTRHVDLDGTDTVWPWTCHSCDRVVILIEEKFRQTKELGPASRACWKTTRQVAQDCSAFAINCMWGNAADNPDAKPELCHLQAMLPGGRITESSACDAVALRAWIVRAFAYHYDYFGCSRPTAMEEAA